MSLDIDLLEKSFELISPKVDELTMMFYSDLFTRHPDLKPFFAHVDLVRQRRKMAAMLTLIVTNLRRTDVLVTVLQTLGAKHVPYGATPERYKWVAESLLLALERVSGEAWDDATSKAWNAAISLISIQMQLGVPEEKDKKVAELIENEDLVLLMEIAANPALSFQMDSLFSNYVQKKRNDYEMDLARSVQQSLIPTSFPELDNYRFSASYQPATQIGGDYFDWIRCDDDSLYIMFGDVSGKGIPGALIMCWLAGTARTLLATENDTSRAFASINAHMCERMPSGRFITLALLNINLKTHHYSMVNGGHQPPLLRNQDETATFIGRESGGIPIGINKDATYQAFEGMFNPGDTLVLYTDGVDEAKNTLSEMYGTDRLCQMASSVSDHSSIGDALLKDVQRFSQGRPQSDDITILTISHLAG